MGGIPSDDTRGNKNITVVVDLDGEVVGRKTVKYMDDVRKRTGRPIFED